MAAHAFDDDAIKPQDPVCIVRQTNRGIFSNGFGRGLKIAAEIQIAKAPEIIRRSPGPNNDTSLQDLMACSDDLVRHYVSVNKTPPEILIALRVRLRMTHQEVIKLGQL